MVITIRVRVTPCHHNDSFLEPIRDEEKRREAEIESLCRQITKEDPGYFDRLADRIIAEFEAEGGAITMEKLLGLPPVNDLTQ